MDRLTDNHPLREKKTYHEEFFPYIRVPGLVEFLDFLKSTLKQQLDGTYHLSWRYLMVCVNTGPSPKPKMLPDFRRAYTLGHDDSYRPEPKHGEGCIKFQIKDEFGENSDFLLRYKDRLVKYDHPSDDTIILTPKNLSDFEKQIQDIPKFPCEECEMRLNRLTTICLNCGSDNHP